MSDPGPSPDTKDYISSVISANANWAERLNQTFPRYFPDPKHKQEPKILWIGCSDSRVQESDATAALPGTVFVHRNIANQFHLHDDNVLSAFAYSIGALSVRHIAIVGHEHCGGALSALERARLSPNDDKLKRHPTLFDSLYHLVHKEEPNDVHDKDSKSPMDAMTRWLDPLVDRVRKLLPGLPPDKEAALKIVIEENVKLQVEFVAQLDEWVRQQKDVKKPVWVHGLVYDFATGFIRDLEITRELGGDSA